MAQFFGPSAQKLNSVALDGFSITPDDSTVFDFFTRGIYVGGTGDVVIVTPYGTELTFKAVPTGTTLAVAAKQVKSTGTTATLLVGLI